VHVTEVLRKVGSQMTTKSLAFNYQISVHHRVNNIPPLDQVVLSQVGGTRDVTSC